MNFVEVTKSAFYEFMGPRNVFPDPGREETIWYDSDRRIVGKKSQGYIPRHGEQIRYYIAATGDSNG